MAPSLPTPRGPLTQALFDHWSDQAPTLPTELPNDIDPTTDDDLQLAL